MMDVDMNIDMSDTMVVPSVTASSCTRLQYLGRRSCPAFDSRHDVQSRKRAKRG
jgi:hypothetical protein